MDNIFDVRANAEFLQRIKRLTPESQPLWGKMNVSQMLWHCQQPLEVATGKLPLSGGLLGLFFGKMAKNSFLKNRGFSKNAPTHPKFKITTTLDFETEKKALYDYVANFGKIGAVAVSNKKTSFFWYDD